MKTIVCLMAAALLTAGVEPVSAQKKEEPQPRVVEPGQPGHAPSDAVVLFDGRDLSAWTTHGGKPPGCKVAEGEINCMTGDGDLISKEKFRDAQIHLEFKEPSMPTYHSQDRGNSGVYLQGRYEIQILDSYQNPTYANGSCGAVYGEYPPLVNANRPPEQWQTYDIIFHGPRCNADGRLLSLGRVTVLLNGVLLQDDSTIFNTGKGCLEDHVGDSGPLQLQDHNWEKAPTTLMKFRNIWLRHLDTQN